MSGVLKTQIQVDSAGTYYEVAMDGKTAGPSGGTKQKLTTAEISLNDCLACRCALCLSFVTAYSADSLIVVVSHPLNPSSSPCNLTRRS